MNYRRCRTLHAAGNDGRLLVTHSQQQQHRRHHPLTTASVAPREREKTPQHTRRTPLFAKKKR